MTHKLEGIPTYATVLHEARNYAARHLQHKGEARDAFLTAADYEETGYPIWLVELHFPDHSVVTCEVKLGSQGHFTIQPLVEGCPATKQQIAEAYHRHDLMRQQWANRARYTPSRTLARA